MTQTVAMPSRELLDRTVRSVLETMFFVEPEDPGEELLPSVESAALLWTAIHFSGAHSGVLVLGLNQSAAIGMAGDFLGHAPEGLQAGSEVLREVANIICGSLLSAWKVESLFDLQAPAPPRTAPTGEFMLVRDYALPKGHLAVRMNLDN